MNETEEQWGMHLANTSLNNFRDPRVLWCPCEKYKYKPHLRILKHYINIRSYGSAKPSNYIKYESHFLTN